MWVCISNFATMWNLINKKWSEVITNSKYISVTNRWCSSQWVYSASNQILCVFNGIIKVDNSDLEIYFLWLYILSSNNI